MAPVTDETTELPTNYALRDRIVTMAGLEGMLTRERLPKRAVARAYAVLNPDEETTPDEEESAEVAILVSFNDLAHLREGLAALVGEDYDPGTGTRPMNKPELVAVHDALCDAVGGFEPLGEPPGVVTAESDC